MRNYYPLLVVLGVFLLLAGVFGSTSAQEGCPPSHPVDCGDGYCCEAGYACCDGGGCCPSHQPIGCPSKKKCYANQMDAEADGCADWVVCGVPVN
jgi:hypothetical protein